ncbi:MAG TPA: VOC family protein [Longimicrobiales bacterium]|nr:VOC family protein [Longimicrobiales bacterium]
MTREGEPGGELRVDGVIETALHVESVPRAMRFYEEVLGLEAMVHTETFAALDAGRRTVLLLFAQGSSTAGTQSAGGFVPGHDTRGPSHLAFAVAGAAELERWVARLEACGVSIESRVTWPRGGTSVYFRDPDGHSVELLTPGLWPNY